jgi:hypothetical protein
MAATIRLSQQHSCSFDHLIGERKHPIRHVDAKLLSSPEIGHEFKFHELLDQQVGRLLAFENAASVDAGLAVCIGDAGRVAHQASC